MPRTSKSTPGTTRNTRTTSRSTNVTKIQAKQFVNTVPEGQFFWVNDGNVLKEMRELRDALMMMSDQTFAYHTNEIKKDFSNWVRDVIGDEILASDLENAANREQAAKIVTERYEKLLTRA